LVHEARKYRGLIPGSIEHLVPLIGYFALPGGHLLNSTPSVNFKTYLDMQFNIVANDPVFWGAYGLGGYHSGYADEQTTRWLLRLYRHYGIEGRSEPATDDPYQPGHIQNGDFVHGTEGWTLDPAEKGSIRPVFERGFGALQARGALEGNSCLVTVRNASRPNVFSQEIKNLQPGRLYSFCMITGDHRDMSRIETHAVSSRIENATLVPEKCFTYLYSNPPWGRYPPYDKPATAWMNYHYRVFRADGDSARLVISDWVAQALLDTVVGVPGGPIGQEIMYNFISVQPYFSEE